MLGKKETATTTPPSTYQKTTQKTRTKTRNKQTNIATQPPPEKQHKNNKQTTTTTATTARTTTDNQKTVRRGSVVEFSLRHSPARVLYNRVVHHGLILCSLRRPVSTKEREQHWDLWNPNLSSH